MLQMCEQCLAPELACLMQLQSHGRRLPEVTAKVLGATVGCHSVSEAWGQCFPVF